MSVGAAVLTNGRAAVFESLPATLVVVVFIALSAWFVLFKKKRNSPPELMQIGELVIYPIKSCAGVSLQKARVERYGLVGDREYSVAVPVEHLPPQMLGRADSIQEKIKGEDGSWTADYQLISARELPKLLLLQPALVEGGVVLGCTDAVPSRQKETADPDSDTTASSATNRRRPQPLVVKTPAPSSPQPAKEVTCHEWGDTSIVGLDQGDDAANWLSDFFDFVGFDGGDLIPRGAGFPRGSLRLVKFVRRANKESRSFALDKNSRQAGRSLAPGRFADGHPLLVGCQQTMEKINEASRLDEPWQRTARRFRWNVRLDDFSTKNSPQAAAVAQALPKLAAASSSAPHSPFLEDVMTSFSPLLCAAAGGPTMQSAWDTIALETGTIDMIKPCARCIIPSTNPVTGKRDGFKMSGALKKELHRTNVSMRKLKTPFQEWFRNKGETDFYVAMNAGLRGTTWLTADGEPDEKNKPFEVEVGQAVKVRYGEKW